MDAIRSLFASNFAPHIYCLRASGAAPLDALSDLFIALAYLAIPLALGSFFRKRRDFQFSWIFALFGVFILSCGLTHILSVYTLWVPIYRFEALVKLVTAISSVLTAIMLWRILPLLLLIPSPERLQAEIDDRKAAEQRVRELNVELEARVGARTAELSELNRRLAAREETLRAMEERLRLALDGGHIGAWDYDASSNNLVLDDRCRAALGMAGAADPLRSDVLAAIDPDDLQAFREQIRNAATDSDGRFASEIRVTGIQDHSPRILSVQGRCLFDQNSSGRTPVRLVGIISDITDRKHQEEDLLRMNDDLRQFAFAAAHDLQEPLRNISVSLQLLEMRFPQTWDPEARELLSQTTEGAQRINAMLRDLLAYSRAVDDSDQTVAVTSANEALRDAIQNLQSRVLESGAEIIAPPSLPQVPINHVHLSQIFQNLIGNAIKYRKPTNKPQIRVSAERQKDKWLFEVVDNGIGFNPIYSEKIFGMFKRLNARHEFGGNGVGLAICKRIVKHYGGTIWADSSPGEGATFWFTLPS